MICFIQYFTRPTFLDKNIDQQILFELGLKTSIVRSMMPQSIFGADKICWAKHEAEEWLAMEENFRYFLLQGSESVERKRITRGRKVIECDCSMIDACVYVSPSSNFPYLFPQCIMVVCYPSLPPVDALLLLLLWLLQHPLINYYRIYASKILRTPPHHPSPQSQTIKYKLISIHKCLPAFIAILTPKLQQQPFMSKVLESVKPEVTRARNLALLGKYTEAINFFGDIITKITAQMGSLNDRNLITEWNRLLEGLNKQRDLASSMRDVLSGNIPTKEPRRERPRIKEEHSESEVRLMKGYSQDNHEERRLSAQPNHARKVIQPAHEDDELYNRKEKESREADRADREREHREKQLRDRQFEEREQQIWPKKKPAPKKAVTKNNNNNNPNPVASNNSGMGKGSRDYSKPWAANAKNPNAKPAEDQKKNFLKSCYPDGNGPDSNLIQMLEKEVISFNPDITFEDIAELEKAKDVLEEAVLLPLLMPHLFKGIRRAWKGVLLFGPPGTGKTLLAKAIASGGKTTFFNVTASSLASKWKGDSEKLVRILFEMAKFYAPTTIFIDEIDSLASKRGEKEDQSSRKVKTQLMTRIDGVSSGEQGKSIVVIGATNRPWDLDEAIRRRLEKRIYIPLPTEVGRREMLRINLKQVQLEASVDLQEVVKKTDGYSGADIALLCRETAYMPMRRKLKRQGGLGKKLGNLQWMKEFQKDVTVPLTMEDFIEALKNVKPSVGKNDLGEYEKWMAEFGEQGTN